MKSEAEVREDIAYKTPEQMPGNTALSSRGPRLPFDRRHPDLLRPQTSQARSLAKESAALSSGC